MIFPKTSLNQIGENLQIALKRFPLTVIALITAAGFLVVQIHSRKDYVDERVWYFLPLAVVASLAFYLFAENRIKCWLKNLLNALLIGLLAWFSFTLTKPIPEAEFIRLALLVVSFGLAVFFAPYVTRNRPMNFWNYLTETIFELVKAFFFGGVFMAGLSLALLSLDKLFGVNIPDRYYGYLATTCFVLFSPLYFLSSVPKENPEQEDKHIDIPPFLKILGLYILLPILGIYLVILYGYSVKIIAAWQLPNGWVSWLVSVLGVAGYLTMFILHPLYLKQENKVVNYFTRFFPVLLLPLLILMFVGILRRFSDYGITINRLLVLLLNLWMFGVSIYLFISKGKQLKWIFISFAAVAFLSAVGPWSVMSVTKRSLSSELKQLLTETKWYVLRKDDEITKYLTPLDTIKEERLHDLIIYLSTTYEKEDIRTFYKDRLGEKATDIDFMNALGVNKQFNSEQYFSAYNNNQSYLENIEGYKIFINISQKYQKDEIAVNKDVKIQFVNNQLEITSQKTSLQLSVPLDSIVQKALSNQNKSFDVNDLTIKGDNYKLIFNSIDGKKEKDNTFTINYFNAILFLK